MAQEQVLMDNTKVFFASKHDVDMVLTYYPCLINTQSQKYAQSEGGFPFRKDSPYQKVFSRKISSIVEHGLWKYARNDARRRKEKFGCGTTNQGYDPMGYNNVFSLFLATVLCIASAIIILLIEYCLKVRK